KLELENLVLGDHDAVRDLLDADPQGLLVRTRNRFRSRGGQLLQQAFRFAPPFLGNQAEQLLDSGTFARHDGLSSRSAVQRARDLGSLRRGDPERIRSSVSGLRR